MMMHVFILGSPVDRFLPIVTVIVLAALVFAFSFAHVPLAWGGIFMAMLGFMLKDKCDKGEAGAESKLKPWHRGLGATAPPVRKKFSLKGSASIFMIYASTIVAIVDIWRNGGSIVSEARAATANAVGSQREDEPARRRHGMGDGRGRQGDDSVGDGRFYERRSRPSPRCGAPGGRETSIARRVAFPAEKASDSTAPAGTGSRRPPVAERSGDVADK
jgi:hypothetical protein